MLIHSVMAGAAALGIVAFFTNGSLDWLAFLKTLLYVSIAANLFTMLIELTTTHPTVDSKRTVKMILKGRYRNAFWIGSILIGNIIPTAKQSDTMLAVTVFDRPYPAIFEILRIGLIGFSLKVPLVMPPL